MADGYSGPRPTRVHLDEVELMDEYADERGLMTEAPSPRHDGEKMEQVTTRDHGVVLEEQVESD